MLSLYIFLFISSCLLLFWASSRLVSALMKVSKLLGWREFVVAFFVMAIAGSLPNLIIGINSAIHKIPELSFGDVIGGNLIDLTLVVALAVLIGKMSLPAKSRMVQSSAIFTAIAAILPIILLIDGSLGRGDGITLITLFFIYIFWLFSKKERFQKVYNDIEEKKLSEHNIGFFKSLGTIIFALFVILVASEGVVRSASFFALASGLELAMVGILIVGLGNALPEMYFAIASAKKEQPWMILGNLMGAVIVPSTLVLGIVALIHPFHIANFTPFILSRIFLILAIIFFLFAVRTDKRITKKEALLLLMFYILFVTLEILLG